MITVSPKHRIFLAIEPIDFRKGIEGISRICKNKFSNDPMSGHYFIFLNKRKTDIKLLYYDAQGYCLFQKRLSAGRFLHWPTTSAPAVTLTPSQLQVLLCNGDPSQVLDGARWRSIDDETQ